MPIHNIGKPNLSKDLKTGFRLMGQKVSRGQRVQRPAVKDGQIATNHPITSVRSALGRKKKGSPMY